MSQSEIPIRVRTRPLITQESRCRHGVDLTTPASVRRLSGYWSSPAFLLFVPD